MKIACLVSFCLIAACAAELHSSSEVARQPEVPQKRIGGGYGLLRPGYDAYGGYNSGYGGYPAGYPAPTGLAQGFPVQNYPAQGYPGQGYPPVFGGGYVRFPGYYPGYPEFGAGYNEYPAGVGYAGAGYPGYAGYPGFGANRPRPGYDRPVYGNAGYPFRPGQFRPGYDRPIAGYNNYVSGFTEEDDDFGFGRSASGDKKESKA